MVGADSLTGRGAFDDVSDPSRFAERLTMAGTPFAIYRLR